jgi:hypothetical protein
VISTLADYGTELTTGVKMFIAQSADVTQSFDNHHDRQLINKNRVESVPFFETIEPKKTGFFL